MQAAITLFGATLVVFTLTHLAPGDPVDMFFLRGSEIAAAEQTTFDDMKTELRRQNGLDKSLPEQYINWIVRSTKFEFGNSIYTGRAVIDEIAARFPATIILSLTTLVLLIAMGMTLGIISALFADGLIDNAIRVFCVLFASIPGFVIGLGALSLFSVNLKLYKINTDLSISTIWLPAIIIAVTLSPQLIRLVRANMLAEFGQIYILSARSRGLKRVLLLKHALKNAILPITTMLGLSLAAMIGGSIVIESIFAWPGIGKYALDSILLHDYPVIQCYSLIMASIIVLVNLIVDIIYVIADPKIRERKSITQNEVV
jgi:peptide/nickel transport system permease protein